LDFDFIIDIVTGKLYTK